MKAVLDTNCFVSCIGKVSPFRNVFDALLSSRFELCVSSEILLEYEEKFSAFWSGEIAISLLGALLTAPNTSLHTVFYRFLLVHHDPDDNKFADTYLVANADYLVSNDNHLLSLRNLRYPPVNVVTLEEFSVLLKRTPVP